MFWLGNTGKKMTLCSEALGGEWNVAWLYIDECLLDGQLFISWFASCEKLFRPCLSWPPGCEDDNNKYWREISHRAVSRCSSWLWFHTLEISLTAEVLIPVCSEKQSDKTLSRWWWGGGRTTVRSVSVFISVICAASSALPHGFVLIGFRRYLPTVFFFLEEVCM